MRIISKTSDYYDSLMDYSKDRLNKTWVRAEQKFELPEFRLKEMAEQRFYWGWKIKMFYLVVAGKVYPIIGYHKDGEFKNRKYIGAHYEYFYTLEDFDKNHPEETRSMFSYRHAKTGYLKNPIGERWRTFFKKYNDLTDLCIELESPVILIEPKGKKFKCTTNVILKDYQFYKVLPTASAYQELDMFVSNILINDEMVAKPITDIDKIEAHGFDKKNHLEKRNRRKNRRYIIFFK